MKFGFIALATALLSSTVAVAQQNPVTIHLNYGSGIKAGSAQYNGFTAAADYWSSVLTTSGVAPVTVNFDVNFAHLPPNVLGSTSSSYTGDLIANVAGRIAASGSGARDAATVLPTLGTGMFGPDTAVSVYTPGYTNQTARSGIDNSTKVYDTDGGLNNSAVNITTANAKALGYTAEEIGNASGVDGSIEFSSDFKFDFNPRNGITAGQSDFYAVAIHEMGHALGFVSGVDLYDIIGTGGPYANLPVTANGTLGKNYNANNDFFADTQDLFRYSAPGVLDWTTNTASYFSLDGGVTAYQGGLFSTGTFNGDGWQASHWKAPQLTSGPNAGKFSCVLPKLGIMNPYICDGQNGIVTALDLAAQDAIGWNINPADAGLGYAKTTAQIAHDLTAVPEPASWAMFIAGFGVIGVLQRRRRGDVATA